MRSVHGGRVGLDGGRQVLDRQREVDGHALAHDVDRDRHALDVELGGGELDLLHGAGEVLRDHREAADGDADVALDAVGQVRLDLLGEARLRDVPHDDVGHHDEGHEGHDDRDDRDPDARRASAGLRVGGCRGCGRRRRCGLRGGGCGGGGGRGGGGGPDDLGGLLVRRDHRGRAEVVVGRRAARGIRRLRLVVVARPPVVHMRSGAETPSRSSPLRMTWPVASFSQSRVRCRSPIGSSPSGSTRQLSYQRW